MSEDSMKIIWIVLISIIAISSANADGVMKVLNLPYTYLSLISVEVTTEINNQVAITTSRQTFSNTTGLAVDLKYGFPLEYNASATQLSWSKHGKEYRAQLTGKPQDTTAVNPGGEIDHQFVDYMGQNPFYFSFRDSLAADSTLTLELTYIQLLSYDAGQVIYRYPLDMKSFLMEPLSHFTAKIQLISERKLLSFDSFPLPDEVNLSENEARLLVNAENYLPDHDFTATFSMEQDSIGVFLLSTKPRNEAGYFLLLAEPNQFSFHLQNLERCFVFIIDQSGSMSGSKFAGAKAGLDFCLQNLEPSDKLNIIAFNENATLFKTTPITANSSNLLAARNFVNSLKSNGGTSLQQALEEGLKQFKTDTNANYILLFSDGQTSLEQARIQALNQHRVRIFVLGIGEDANRYLLTPLAEKNYGFSTYIDDVWEAQPIQLYFDKIRYPMLRDIHLTFQGGEVDSIYPQKPPDIYVGEQLVILGRYNTPGLVTIQLSGRTINETLSLSYLKNFSAGSTSDHFIMKMWAKKLLEELIGQLAAFEENSYEYKNLVRQIIDISIRFGIMTPFTSYRDPGTPTNVEIWDAISLTFPGDFQLLQNYPNPFNTMTKISFGVERLIESQKATLIIYNLLGEVVHRFDFEIVSPGIYSIDWDGSDILGQKLASGTYIYVLKIGDVFLKKKLVLLR